MGTPNDIAKSFLDAYVGKYGAADANGLSQLYGDDSAVSFDGQTVRGRAGIMQAMGPRVSSATRGWGGGRAGRRAQGTTRAT